MTATIIVNREKMQGETSEIRLFNDELYVVQRDRHGKVISRTHIAPQRGIDIVIKALQDLKTIAT